ncbi:MAG: Fic family protein [Clostridia bacterium]
MKLEMLPYKNVNLKTNKILEQLTLSSRALAELKGYANTIPNMHILINAVTINEAKDSSAIENIVTTHDDIYKVLTESGYKEENAKEVVDYRNAIWAGYEQIKKDGFINTNTIVKIQGIIEHNNAGIRKLPGTELKNSLTGETIYTPPQNEEEIRDYLRNLEEFINNNEYEIDPLIKVCLIHYQFESIHPFYDGNGRTGRILNILYLVLNKLIDSPILYLSKYINKTKQEYYKLFNEVRNNNNFEDWILYILKGIGITSKETITLIEKIQNEMKNYEEEFRTKLPKIYSKELLESLFYEVYTKIAYIEKACSVTRLTATSYLNQLEEIGLLESEKIGREKIYKNLRLIKLLSDELEIK